MLDRFREISGGIRGWRKRNVGYGGMEAAAMPCATAGGMVTGPSGWNW